jgi:DNA modification methylase
MKDVILHGDVYACLDQVEDNSVTVAITSPPYWKQRDYGFKGQIGQENTPEEYIGRLITIFNKLKEKLRKDGIFFLNVGDKYLSKYGKSHLLQIPYRLAYHLVKNGWYLEDVLIWFKPNHMPSSVRDRFTNTYEPILVLSKDKRNIYNKGSSNVIKVPLQQTQWKHTAIFPEKLVEELLKRVNLSDGDIILDPFAGTGTVGVVVKKIRNSLFSKDLSSIMIEKGDAFVDIIKKRCGIKDIKKINDVPYEWSSVKEERIPGNIKPKEILIDKRGEVFIASTSNEFIQILKGITTEKFKTFHHDDALYFFGVKKWLLQDLYYAHSIIYEGYVLRNMIVFSDKKTWYPIFMFAKDTTKVEYNFYLDQIRQRSKIGGRNWWNENFVGKKVKDISGKKPKEGRIIEIIKRYPDGFPKVVIVRWNGYVSMEFVLHPNKDTLIREGLVFKCPKCKSKLEKPYNPLGSNICDSCGEALWNDVNSIPIIEEPNEIRIEINALKDINYNLGEIIKIDKFKEAKQNTKSKFVELERINWGASPGARKLMLGEYFTKMRLYKLDQPMVAQYLNLLRKQKGLNIKEIINKFPSSYKHTVGHWFRKDFGGSIPLPTDVPLLKKIFGDNTALLNILERTALKFQTVKAAIKGKNPGDFVEGLSEKELILYFRKLITPL